jgi:Protein of unknown function (DUF3106)
MRRFARSARAWALSALALVASVLPAFGQEVPPDALQPAPRATTAPRERGNQRVEAMRGERARIQREAPPGFVHWARELPPAQRRQLERRLRRMPEPQRQRFFREWDRLSIQERRELAERLTLAGEARRRRELPPRLRTPEMRERLEAMSPEERREFMARARAWREMNAGERHRMRSRLERFGTLTEGEQQALVDERFERQSPEQRARILRELRGASRQLRELRGAPGARAPTPPAGAPTPPAEPAPAPAPH